MPELPDLTLYRRNLCKQILHKPIQSADVFNQAKVNVPAEAFREALVGSEFTEIARDGKELFFTLQNEQAFSVHLMLSGRFSLIPWTDAHRVNSKIICIGFADGAALTVSDYQRMARVTLNPPKPTVPDALSDAFTYAYLEKIVAKKPSANIKALLIDQKVVRGIGNAYVDEILWKAGISPKSFAGKIPPEYLQALYDAIRWVMEDAIEQITRISPDIISGEERSFLRVHHPRKRTTDAGDPIICEDIAKKRTYYTNAQRLFW